MVLVSAAASSPRTTGTAVKTGEPSPSTLGIFENVEAFSPRTTATCGNVEASYRNGTIKLPKAKRGLDVR